MVATNIKPARPSADEVMSQLAERAPHLVEHCYLDRSWIWYCGPSLQKDAAARTVLKELGFRYSPAGHEMPDGVTRGSWGHSCQKPMFPKRKVAATPADRSVDDEIARLMS